MSIDKNMLKALWYAGLGREYSASRGALGGAGSHDSSRHRRFYYVVVGTVQLVMCGGLFYLAWISAAVFPWMGILCAAVALVVFAVALQLYHAYMRLSKAVKTQSDGDLNDPMRLRAMQRAFRWGRKNGIVIPRGDGSWHYSGPDHPSHQ